MKGLHRIGGVYENSEKLVQKARKAMEEVSFMRITGWTFCDNPQYQEINNIDYDAVRRLVVEEIRKRGYKFSGYYHQGGEYGIPIIDGKYTVLYSYRSWGSIMADAYDIRDEDRLAYCKWAWTAPVDETSVFPCPKDYTETSVIL